MEKTCSQFHVISNEKLLKLMSNLFEMKQNKRSILIYGNAGAKKSFFIQFFAHLYSLVFKKQFLLHWIKLDSIEKDCLLGNFNEKKKSKGLMEQLIDAINLKKDLPLKPQNFIKKEIPKNEYFVFNSEPANRYFSERTYSNEDWIIIDNSFLGNYYEQFIEMLIDRQIHSEDGKKISIHFSNTQIYEVFFFFKYY